MAVMNITKVVRENTAIEFSKTTRSFGGMIDERLRDAVDNDEEIQTLAIEFEAAEWDAFVRFIRERLK